MKAGDQGGGQTQVDTEEWGVVIILKTETSIFILDILIFHFMTCIVQCFD